MSDLCAHCGMAIYKGTYNENPYGLWLLHGDAPHSAVEWRHSSAATKCNESWAEPALVTWTSPTLAERDQARRIAVALEQENAFLLDECAALQRALTECQYLLNGWYTAAHQLGAGTVSS